MFIIRLKLCVLLVIIKWYFYFLYNITVHLKSRYFLNMETYVSNLACKWNNKNIKCVTSSFAYQGVSFAIIKRQPRDGRAMAARWPRDGRAMAARWLCHDCAMALLWPCDSHVKHSHAMLLSYFLYHRIRSTKPEVHSFKFYIFFIFL